MSFDEAARRRAWYVKNKVRCCASSAKYRRNHPEKVKAQRISWVTKNLERKRKTNREYMRNWNRLNPEVAAQRKREYYARDPERIKAMWRRATAKRKLDPNKKILSDLRKAIHRALKHHNTQKCSRTLDILGCSIPSFRMYIESKFEPGMTWNNYGLKGWHLDHIIPCAIFDLTRTEHQKRCFHFSNLQPLWAFENLSKGSRITELPAWKVIG